MTATISIANWNSLWKRCYCISGEKIMNLFVLCVLWESRLLTLGSWYPVFRQPTLDEVVAWARSFELVMRSSEGREIFREFLRSEYSEENLLFWLACEELKKETDPTAIDEKARIIYEDYVSILSPKEVGGIRLDAGVWLVPSITQYHIVAWFSFRVTLELHFWDFRWFRCGKWKQVHPSILTIFDMHVFDPGLIPRHIETPISKWVRRRWEVSLSPLITWPCSSLSDCIVTVLSRSSVPRWAWIHGWGKASTWAWRSLTTWCTRKPSCRSTPWCTETPTPVSSTPLFTETFWTAREAPA